jgi:hypothetical protein
MIARRRMKPETLARHSSEATAPTTYEGLRARGIRFGIRS